MNLNKENIFSIQLKLQGNRISKDQARELLKKEGLPFYHIEKYINNPNGVWLLSSSMKDDLKI